MSDPGARRDRSVVILGAGLTGLSAALELTRSGVDHWLVEKQPHVGGLASTSVDAGYRFDHTGHLLHLGNRERWAHVLSLLDDAPLEVARRSLIYSEHVYTRYPYQSNTHGLPPETAYSCLLDFVEARLRPATEPPQNFEQFCRCHFGNAIAERFMLPYNRRLWGVEPSEVTTSWCDRFVPIPELSDVIAGAVGFQSRELGYNTTGLYPARGIGELASAMARHTPSLVLRSSPKRIDAARRRIDFGDWSASYHTLISTLPLPTLVGLLSNPPEEITRAIRMLRCAPLYYLDVALYRRPRVDAHWVYVPEARFPFYRVGNYAAFSESMAPPGAACLYVELANREEPVLDRVWPEVQRGLTELGFIEGPDDVAFCRTRHIEHAYVIYDCHRDRALQLIDGYLASMGILSTGRYGGWNYSSMEDALAFGEQAAHAALASS